MHVRNLVRRNEYRDSVMLMKASESVQAVPGVLYAALIMGTEANKNLLSRLGLLTEEGRQASAEDLVIAIQAVDERSAGSALSKAMGCLEDQGRASGGMTFRLLDSAIQAIPDANLAIVSVPGTFAGREAKRALQRGLNVFLFSDNVPIQEEVELKTMARERELLLMGPECGTAIINHVGIGFANAVRPGTIGIVAASGTGLQEVSVLIHRQGLGISQAIGVGGRDLSAGIGRTRRRRRDEGYHPDLQATRTFHDGQGADKSCPVQQASCGVLPGTGGRQPGQQRETGLYSGGSGGHGGCRGHGYSVRGKEV
jgi:FdrA protein